MTPYLIHYDKHISDMCKIIVLTRMRNE